MATRAPRKYLLRRSKDNLTIMFARRARRVGNHPLGNLQAVASSRSGRIDIKNIEETELRGADFFEIRNVRFNHWFTRNWNTDRELIARDVRVASHTSRGDVIAEINNLTGYTTEQGTGDEGGSGLSSVGGTSVVSFRMESVNYSLEDGTGNLLYEDDDTFVSEELNTVIQRNDGTFLSVDTRSVSHGASGGAGNPVVSGAVSSNTMTLTLDDASTVDIDVTTLADSGGGSATYILQEDGFQLQLENEVGSLLADEVHTSVSTGVVSGTDLILTMNDGSTLTIALTSPILTALPYWYQTYANPGTGDTTPGPRLTTLTPALDTGPWHYGRQLARGEEFLFDHTSSSQARWLGIWGTGATYDATDPGRGSYWTKSFRFSAADQISQSGSGTYTQGFDISTAYDVVQGATKFALVYDYSSYKLQLWERHTGANSERRTLITTANDAEDGNPVTISGAYEVSGGDLPTFTAREHTWEIVANEMTPDDTTWRDGAEVNTVIRHGTALHPGEKMTCVAPNTWSNHYFSWDYTGTATGQASIAQYLDPSFRATSSEDLREVQGYTINPYATRYDSSTQTETGMGGAKISLRYHIDNSLDVFDEDNEEVLFTKDTDMDGNPAYLYIGFTGGALSNMMWTDWTFEPFDGAWYKHPSSRYIPNHRFTGDDFDGSGRWIWGEKMYPGQELIFQEGMGGSGNTYIGTRNGDDTAWVRYVGFDGTNIDDVAVGFDIASNYASGYGVNNKWVALRYDYGDNKLKWYDINTTGAETLITTATVACDGNAIRIVCSGNNKVPLATELRYYGWEYVHTATASPQPWKNWRIDRPSVNTSIKNDTVVKHRLGLLPGNYMRWTTPESGVSTFFGGWKSSMSASGNSNVDANSSYWDWGFRMNNSEQVIDLHNMSFNTANEDYDATGDSNNGVWDDPDKGTTQIQFRYHASNNTIDLHDHTNNRIIATKDSAADGNAMYLGIGMGTNTATLEDNFMGGGDVEIAASTFSPTFTTAASMGYDDDGILNATEMVRIDTAVPVGKRMIISPEFWGLLEDMGGVEDSGPAPTGTGWVENDVVIIGWQEDNSPHVGTNIGNSNSGWDAAMYMQLRGAGTNHTSRVALYSPANATFTSRDGRVYSHYFTDLYFTFDRIATDSGRIMAFSKLAHARAGIAGTSPETTWYAVQTDDYMTGNAQALTLTSDFYLYIYSSAGNFTLPTTTTDCIEVITIPT